MVNTLAGRRRRRGRWGSALRPRGPQRRPLDGDGATADAECARDFATAVAAEAVGAAGRAEPGRELGRRVEDVEPREADGADVGCGRSARRHGARGAALRATRVAKSRTTTARPSLSAHGA